MKQGLAKSIVQDLRQLPVMESFLTLQGEGFYSGKPAFFIRVSGCDVGCHWCDVKDSWEAQPDQMRSIEAIVEEAILHPGEIVVITGGEPMMYDMDILTRALRGNGKKTHMETAGVYAITGEWDWICFSPKKFKDPLPEYYQRADELKVVIFNKADFDWAESHAQKMNGEAELFLQPEWSRRHEMIPLIVSYIKSNPRWRISLQTHKYLDIP